MSETKEIIEEEIKEEVEEEIKEEVEEEAPLLTIESWDDLFRASCIAKGIDPNQVQSMAKFSNFDSNDERSYYPTQLTAIAIAQSRIFGDAFYKGEEWNEYTDIADFLSVSLMGYRGFKSGQYVDITSGQPNLEKIQGQPDEIKKGILSGVYTRGK